MQSYLKYLLNILKAIFSVYISKESNSSEAVKKIVPSIIKDEETGKIPEPEPKKVVKQDKVKPKFGFGTTPRITSNFGWRKIPGVLNGKPHFHSGLDFSANRTWGYPCRAIEDGVITKNSKAKGSQGITVVGMKGDTSKCHLFYCHIGSKDGQISPLVKVGQRVKCGDVIGFCNSTGYITGPHLHLTVYDMEWNIIDPMCYYKKYAPELVSQIIGYVDKGHINKNNKTGKKCGVI